MKKWVFALFAFCLSAFSISAQSAGSEPMPKNGLAANATVMVVCQKAAYPGGFSCSAPQSLGGALPAADLDAYLVQNLGCTGSGVYLCVKNGMNGVFMYWAFSSTNTVSTILYVPW